MWAELRSAPTNTLNKKLVIEVKVVWRQHAEGLPPHNLYFYYVYMKIVGESRAPLAALPNNLHVDEEVVVGGRQASGMLPSTNNYFFYYFMFMLGEGRRPALPT